MGLCFSCHDDWEESCHLQCNNNSHCTRCNDVDNHFYYNKNKYLKYSHAKECCSFPKEYVTSPNINTTKCNFSNHYNYTHNLSKGIQQGKIPPFNPELNKEG